jgi:hypothetical protein
MRLLPLTGISLFFLALGLTAQAPIENLSAPDPGLKALAKSLLSWLQSAPFKASGCPAFFQKKMVALNELLGLVETEIDYHFIGVEVTMTAGRVTQGTSKPFGLADWGLINPGEAARLMGRICQDSARSNQGTSIGINADTEMIWSDDKTRFTVNLCPSFFAAPDPVRRSTILHELMHVYLGKRNMKAWEDKDVRAFLMDRRDLVDSSLDNAAIPYTYDLTEFFINGCKEPTRH